MEASNSAQREQSAPQQENMEGAFGESPLSSSAMGGSAGGGTPIAPPPFNLGNEQAGKKIGSAISKVTSQAASAIKNVAKSIASVAKEVALSGTGPHPAMEPPTDLASRIVWKYKTITSEDPYFTAALPYITDSSDLQTISTNGDNWKDAERLYGTYISGLGISTSLLNVVSTLEILKVQFEAIETSMTNIQAVLGKYALTDLEVFPFYRPYPGGLFPWKDFELTPQTGEDQFNNGNIYFNPDTTASDLHDLEVAFTPEPISALDASTELAGSLVTGTEALTDNTDSVLPWTEYFPHYPAFGWSPVYNLNNELSTDIGITNEVVGILAKAIADVADWNAGGGEGDPASVLQEPVDLSNGYFDPQTLEDYEMLKASTEPVTVNVVHNFYGDAEMDVIWENGAFQSSGDTATFLEFNAPALTAFLGGTVQLGVNAKIENDTLIGDPTVKVNGAAVSMSSIADLLAAIDLSGLGDFNPLPAGEESLFGGTYFDIQFEEGQLNFLVGDIPFHLGGNFKGSLDLGWKNGGLHVAAKLLVQISADASGIIELNYEGGEFSGEGDVFIAHGPFSGQVKVAYAAGQVTIDGTVEAETDNFKGSAEIVYGTREVVNGRITSELSRMGLPEPQFPAAEEGTESEHLLLGIVTGSVPLSKENDVHLTAEGIVDSEGGMVMKVGLTAQDIELMKEAKDDYEMDISVPAAQWGIPGLAHVSADMVFGLRMGYDIGPVMLKNAEASGHIAKSKYLNEVAVDMKGDIGFDDDIYIGGDIGIGVEIDGWFIKTEKLLLDAALDLHLGGSVDLDLQAGVSMDFNEDNELHPYFSAYGNMQQHLDPALHGEFSWHNIAFFNPKSGKKDLGGVKAEVGRMNLGISYDVDAETPFHFGAPVNKADGTPTGDGIFELNDWHAFFDSLQFDAPHPEHTEHNPGTSEPEVDTGTEGVTDEQEQAIESVAVQYINGEGEVHKLMFEVNDTTDELEIWRHSTPLKLIDYCTGLLELYQTDVNNGNTANAPKRDALIAFKTKLESNEWKDDVEKVLADPTLTNQLKKAAYKELHALSLELTDLDIFGLDSDAKPDKRTHADWSTEYSGGTPNAKPTKAEVYGMHNDQGVVGEESSKFPTTSNPTLTTDAMSLAWEYIDKWRLNNHYVRFHILNNHLGGKANKANLIAATGQENTDFEKKLETFFKEGYIKGRVLWFEADIDYHTSQPGSDFSGNDFQAFPKSFKATGGYLADTGETNWQKIEGTEFSYNLPNMPLPQPTTHNIEINKMNKGDVPGVIKGTGWDSKFLEHLIENKGGNYSDDSAKFSSFDLINNNDLEDAVQAAIDHKKNGTNPGGIVNAGLLYQNSKPTTPTPPGKKQKTVSIGGVKRNIRFLMELLKKNRIDFST